MVDAKYSVWGSSLKGASELSWQTLIKVNLKIFINHLN